MSIKSLAKKSKNRSYKSSPKKTSKKSQNSKNATAAYLLRIVSFAKIGSQVALREGVGFAIGILPFAVCVYSAIFLVHSYDLPLPPIAFAMPLAVLMLFLLKPSLERAVNSKNAYAYLYRYLDNAIEKTADRLLFVMPLCFVPIGVGIVKDTAVLIDAWFLLLLVIVPHTVLTITATIVLLKKLDTKIKTTAKTKAL